jgi:hypothetical protein
MLPLPELLEVILVLLHYPQEPPRFPDLIVQRRRLHFGRRSGRAAWSSTGGWPQCGAPFSLRHGGAAVGVRTSERAVPKRGWSRGRRDASPRARDLTQASDSEPSSKRPRSLPNDRRVYYRAASPDARGERYFHLASLPVPAAAAPCKWQAGLTPTNCPVLLAVAILWKMSLSSAAQNAG